MELGAVADTPVVVAVGVWFYSVETDRYLYLLRNDHRNPGHWGLPGGKVEANETLLQTINRECREELGDMPHVMSLTPIEQFTNTTGGFIYHTFFALVHHEFQPVLNHEHLGYAWIRSGQWPRPLHPGLWNMINLEHFQGRLDSVKKRKQLDT